jgi:hypothetical protein
MPSNCWRATPSRPPRRMARSLSRFSTQAGHPRIKDVQGTPFTVADLLSEIKQTVRHCSRPTRQRGIGLAQAWRRSGTVPGHTGSNPWAKETLEPDPAVVLENSNPALAAALAQQAGVEDLIDVAEAEETRLRHHNNNKKKKKKKMSETQPQRHDRSVEVQSVCADS